MSQAILDKISGLAYDLNTMLRIAAAIHLNVQVMTMPTRCHGQFYDAVKVSQSVELTKKPSSDDDNPLLRMLLGKNEAARATAA